MAELRDLNEKGLVGFRRVAFFRQDQSLVTLVHAFTVTSNVNHVPFAPFPSSFPLLPQPRLLTYLYLSTLNLLFFLIETYQESCLVSRVPSSNSCSRLHPNMFPLTYCTGWLFLFAVLYAAGLLFGMVFFVSHCPPSFSGLLKCFQIIMYSDLESDYINPIDFCNKLNQVCHSSIPSWNLV